MRVILEVEDERAAFFLEILSHFEFVTLVEVVDGNAEMLDSVAAGILEVKSAERGEIKPQNAREPLDEL